MTSPIKPGELIDCRACGGLGSAEVEGGDCPACKGEGKVPYRPLLPKTITQPSRLTYRPRA